MTTPELIHPAHAVGPMLAEFTRQISQDLAGETPELPGFPQVALRVRRALAQEEISIDDVVRIVSAEPSLAVRLLELANSAALNPRAQRVTTLRTAIARMGFSLARSATMAFAMSQMCRAAAWRELATHFREIWDTSSRLAAISYVVAKHRERDDADQALLAGMLHAMGRLFVLLRLSAFPALLEDPAMRAEIEHTWRARAGRTLLERWELGADVLDAACDFDHAHAPGSGQPSLSDVLLASRYLVGVLDPAEVVEAAFITAPAFQRLKLDAPGAASVLSASAAEIASLRAALAD